jgi:hypothetical protein
VNIKFTLRGGARAKRLRIPALEYLKFNTLRRRRCHLDELLLIQVYRGLKYCPSFWKLSVFQSLLGISDTFLCSVSALQLKTALLLDTHQLLMLSAGTLMYLKQILFPLAIFYNNCGIIHILDTNYIQYKFIYVFFSPFLPASHSID